MNREKKIVLAAHCLLNVNAKVYGIANAKGGSNLIGEVIAKGYGIIQLPCVEMAMYGSQRWGIVYEQNDFPAFREKCAELLKPIVHQVVDYAKHGYKISAVIGADYSPTCAVNITPKGDWGGEFIELNPYQKKIENLRVEKGMGVMMEELNKLISANNIETNFYAINEMDLQSYQEILNVL